VKITLPVHPYAGQRLHVVKEPRGTGYTARSGRLRVEDPQGRSFEVPIEWTDRAPVALQYARQESAVRAAPPQLLALAQLVEAWRAELQPTASARGMLVHAERRPSASMLDAVARPRARSAAAPRRGAGGRAAPSPGRK